jgi:lysophospholipase L1-like esterase
MSLQNNDVVLFNGDSITDWGRDRTELHSLSGYNAIIANAVQSIDAPQGVAFYNRGVSADTSAQLLARLPAELESIKPTVFSLLIGINDTWRKFDANSPSTAAQFEETLTAIINAVTVYTKRIIILEPFLLTSDPEKAKFREDLDPKIAVVRKVAAKYHAEFIPLDGIFAELSVKHGAEIFSADGVHPTDAGFRVIATEWLKRML